MAKPHVEVKYCYSEKETNEFLASFSLDQEASKKLHSIEFLCTHSGTVIAVIQYIADISEGALAYQEDPNQLVNVGTENESSR
ncbi:MAG: hypothetical protein J6Z11_16805 [Candidatus Riflebacteria bacterium]|nr:hypothetical protein [Candidatus Riflebacteria bacterium]